MAVLSVTYKELSSIVLEQPYYANLQSRKGLIDAVPNISLTPDVETKELLQRMDMVLREVPGGVIILARVLGTNGGGDPLLRFPVRAGSRLRFHMRLNTPDVLAVNDFPVAADPSKLIYLSNTVGDGSAGRDNLHLSQSATGIAGGSDVMSFTRNLYRFTHNANLDPEVAVVTHLLTGATLAPASCINEGSTAQLLFDLSTIPAGICELSLSGNPEDLFYHLADAGAGPVFGVIELALDSALPANYRIVEPDRSLSPERPKYIVRLVSRKTRWRYTVQMQPGGPLHTEFYSLSNAARSAFLSKLNIVTNDAAVSFTAQAPGPGDMLVFVSDTALSLREAYFNGSGAALSLALTKNIGDVNTEAIVKRGLPYPSSRLINATAAPDIYSDTFLTI